MKKILIVLAIVIIVSIFVFAFTSCSNDSIEPLQKIRGQELINNSTSPNNEYIIKAYKNSGGATVDWAVLCTLTDTKTKKTKNIYWKYKTDCAVIEWVDNDTVIINNVTLDLPDDTYDWRYN